MPSLELLVSGKASRKVSTAVDGMMQYDADVHTELIDLMRLIQRSHLVLHLQSQISTEVSIQRFAQ